MIIEVNGVESNEPSDAASTTNTIVVSDLSEQKAIPAYLLPLVYASLLTSLLAFLFSILNSVKAVFTIQNSVVGTVLPFIFTLPHHGATLLLKWLQHHNKALILPFSPSSPRIMTYFFFLVRAWVVSTTLCAMSLHKVSTSAEGLKCFYLDGTQTSCLKLLDYWEATAAVLILCITSICYLHYRRYDKLNRVHIEPQPVPLASEPKALVV